MTADFQNNRAFGQKSDCIQAVPIGKNQNLRPCLKERFPKAHPFVTIGVGATHREFTYAWNVAKFKDVLRRDGAYLLRSNQADWSAQEFWFGKHLKAPAPKLDK